MGKQTHLAEALGITVEELQEAYEEARLAAIDAAVEAGLITQEQADEMIIGGGFGKGGPRGFGHRGMEGQAGLIDFQALLAEALDISVEELQGAMEQARDAGIAQAIEEGLITQEQADQMQAFQELRNYIDKEALMAEALGISAEELEEARAGGETLSTLLEELDLTAVEVREALEAAHERAVAEAVADGVITQEQADQILSHKGFGFRGPGSGGPGFGGRGRRFGGGNGGFHPQFPFPNAPAEGA
jgi:formaldehyde-activating enzyme involved in methanogenesis